MTRPIGIGALALHALAADPDQVAFDHHGRRLTYRECRRAILVLAGQLAEVGVGADTTVLQVRPNDPEHWLITAACFVLGARSCSIPPGMLSGDTLARRFDDIAADVVIADADSSDDLVAWLDRHADVRRYGLPGGQQLDPWAWSHVGEPIEPDPGVIVRLGFTSGTGGAVKGVDLSSAAMGAVATVLADQLDWPQRPRVLIGESLSGGFGNLVVPVLLRGGTVVLPQTAGADALERSLAADRANVLAVMPPLLRDLVARQTLPALDLLIYSGDVLTHEEIAHIEERAGHVLCGVFGQVEVPKTISCHRPDDHHGATARSLGRPFDGTECRVVDPNGHDVVDGAIGELWVRSATAATGYAFGDGARTMLVDGWVRTGDLVRLDTGGYLFHCGRVEDALADQPGWISAQDVEAEAEGIVLLAGHSNRVTVVTTTAPPPVEAVQRALADRGLEADRIVAVDQWPRTFMGRVDRHALRERVHG